HCCRSDDAKVTWFGRSPEDDSPGTGQHGASVVDPGQLAFALPYSDTRIRHATGRRAPANARSAAGTRSLSASGVAFPAATFIDATPVPGAPVTRFRPHSGLMALVARCPRRPRLSTRRDRPGHRRPRKPVSTSRLAQGRPGTRPE